MFISQTILQKSSTIFELIAETFSHAKLDQKIPLIDECGKSENALTPSSLVCVMFERQNNTYTFKKCDLLM